MNEYSFELLFQLNKGEDPEQYLDSLFETGCDDATVGIGKRGRIALNFTRESENALPAIMSAIQNVQNAIPHAKFERASPDLLNISELAFEFGLGKENMRKYARNQSAKKTPFPTPHIESEKSDYWRASEVAQWLSEHKIQDVDDSILETLVIIQMLNLAIESSRIPLPSVQFDIEQMIKAVA